MHLGKWGWIGEMLLYLGGKNVDGLVNLCGLAPLKNYEVALQGEAFNGMHETR